MRNIRAMAACALSLAATSTWANGFDTLETRDSWRPFVGLGFTSGGDTMLKVNLVPKDGSGSTYREDVSSGGGLDLRAGVSRRLGELPLTAQFAVAFHNDQVNGIAGEKARFRRVPIEATLLWHATDRARIGFGVRKALRPTFKVDNVKFAVDGQEVTASGKFDFKSSVGIIVEAEYALTPSWGLKGRYVFESYRLRNDPQGERFDANHLGVNSVWYFD